MKKSEYLERLRLAVEHLHGCRAEYSATVPVHEMFRGKTVWQGDVEVYTLTGHPKAKRCYGWTDLDGKDKMAERFVAVLEITPVDSPMAAVRASIVATRGKLKS